MTLVAPPQLVLQQIAPNSQVNWCRYESGNQKFSCNQARFGAISFCKRTHLSYKGKS